jgi:succinate dehydrogenase / fumarate reductase cytochrome b subunit
MAITGKVGILAGLRYRGKQGMLNWILHRITGLGIVFFVGIHVVAAFFMQQLGDDLSTRITAIYESRPTQLVVYFCVLFHALNGARLALMDLFPPLLRFERELTWLQWGIFIPAYGLPAFFLLRAALAGQP